MEGDGGREEEAGRDGDEAEGRIADVVAGAAGKAGQTIGGSWTGLSWTGLAGWDGSGAGG